MTGSDEIASHSQSYQSQGGDPDGRQPRRGRPDWSDPRRCRDRLVFDAGGQRLGHVDGVLHAPGAEPRDAGEQGTGSRMFVVLVLGSVSRLGNEARAVPADLLAEEEPGRYVLLCGADAVRTAPIHVEGRRCSCAEWFVRVSEHFAAFGPTGQPSGKPPHSSSP